MHSDIPSEQDQPEIETLQEQLLRKKTQQIQRVRQGHEAWLQQHLSGVTHSVTLTFRKAPVRAFQNKFTESLTMNSPEMLDQYSEALRRFGKKLNRSLFGNAAQRYGKSILMIPVFEGLREDRTPHLHLAIGVPATRLLGFQDEVVAAWSFATPFAGRTKTEVVHDKFGWTSHYISKQCAFIDRPSIDWNSVMPLKS